MLSNKQKNCINLVHESEHGINFMVFHCFPIIKKVYGKRVDIMKPETLAKIAYRMMSVWVADPDYEFILSEVNAWINAEIEAELAIENKKKDDFKKYYQMREYCDKCSALILSFNKKLSSLFQVNPTHELSGQKFLAKTKTYENAIKRVMNVRCNFLTRQGN